MLTIKKVIDSGLKVITDFPVTEAIEPKIADILSPVELRDYQQETIEDIEGLFNIKKIVSAEIYCGGGKTIVGGSIIAKTKEKHPEKHTFFISPNRAGFKHFKADIERVVTHTYGLKHSITISGFEKEKTIHIMTHISFLNWKKKNPEQFDEIMSKTALVVMDEAHRYPEDEGESVYIGELTKILLKYVKAYDFKLLALTGTHFRTDNYLPLGIKDVDIRITMQDLVDKGMAPEVYGISIPIKLDNTFKVSLTGEEMLIRPKDVNPADIRKNLMPYYEQIVSIIRKIHKGDPTAGHCVFTSSCEDAHNICEEINRVLKAPLFAEMTSKSGKVEDRPEILAKLQNGSLLGYVTVNVGAESLNVKRLKYCHIISRTISDVKLMQMVGRIMRKCEGKPRVFIVDYQVMKSRIMKLAKGLKDVSRLSGSNRSFRGIGDGICLRKETELPDCTISIGEFEALITREFKKEGLTPEDKKEKLLKIAEKGGVKPSIQSANKEEVMLAIALYSYTNPHSSMYDLAFDNQIRALRPDWFNRRGVMQKRKEFLYVLAIEGHPRPSTKDSNVEIARAAMALYKLTNIKNPFFEEFFNIKIRKQRPDWFINSADIKKEKLIEWAKAGKPKPSPYSKDKEEVSLAKALYNYTAKHRKKLYDPEFDKLIRELRPDWFRRERK